MNWWLWSCVGVVLAIAARRLARRPARPPVKGAVLVTGASGGIGEEIAAQLAKRGCPLIITGTRKEKLEEVAASCQKLGSPKVAIVVGDLTKQETIDAAAAAVRDDVGGSLSGLVLNAGVGQISPFDESNDYYANFTRVMEINVDANVRLTQRLLGPIRNGNGRIMVVSSLSGFLPTPLRTAYCASKHAVCGFFGALRSETGIPVTIVCPSFVKTEFHDRALSHESGGPPKRHSSSFMTPAECARLSIEAMDRGDIELVMTSLGKVARLFYSWAPGFASKIINRKALATNKKHQ